MGKKDKSHKLNKVNVEISSKDREITYIKRDLVKSILLSLVAIGAIIVVYLVLNAQLHIRL